MILIHAMSFLENLKTVMKTLQIIIFISLSIFANGQANDNNIQQTVLKKNIVNKLFKFGKWTEEGNPETHLRYLGKVETRDGKLLKIMNYTWIGGLSKRATCRILIFNRINQYVGCYGLGMIYDLPDELVNGNLIFTNYENDDCDQTLKTIVSLKNGLPDKIFLKCKGTLGNSYVLDTGN
jgi:hypothetical protein